MNRPLRKRPLIVGSLLVTGLCLWGAVSLRTACAEPSYPLDRYSRVVLPGAKLPCESGEIDTQSYRGTHLRYASAARVHGAFRERLEAFEQVAVATARAVYGRAPTRLVHLGTYNCRRMRRYRFWMSEHAFGNGIDLAGFDFGPRKRADGPPPAGLPAVLRKPFRVRVQKHWDAERGAGAVHARFLRLLAERLIEREDIFSTLLGPGWPGHHNHFHFDRAPYRTVEGFDS